MQVTLFGILVRCATWYIHVSMAAAPRGGIEKIGVTVKIILSTIVKPPFRINLKPLPACITNSVVILFVILGV